jgi:hypothetical protein
LIMNIVGTLVVIPYEGPAPMLPDRLGMKTDFDSARLAVALFTSSWAILTRGLVRSARSTAEVKEICPDAGTVVHTMPANTTEMVTKCTLRFTQL